MRYEIIGNLKIPKIGFGTWTLGGRDTPDPDVEDKTLTALFSALDLGYTHFDTAEYYAGGHAEELLGTVVCERKVPREKLFITTKVSPEHLRYDQVITCCENSLRRLKMEYIDLYLIHWPMKGMNLPDTFRALNKLVLDGKVRHLGVSNFKLRLLKQAVSLSETPLITNQVPYSLFDRTYAKNGVLNYCQQNNILLTAYSPVKPGRKITSITLDLLAKSKGISEQQAALAWLMMQPRVITIPRSFNPGHQAENFRAADILLSDAEMEELSKGRLFRR